MRGRLFLAAGMLSLTLALYFVVSEKPSYEDSTVMITNLAGNSGGSGTIVSSSDLGSHILTNSHVCEVVKLGGIVHSDNGNYFVESYKQSHIHDLCLITVPGNLHITTPVASNPPSMYDKSIVVGHPRLLPTIITEGFFSGKMVINVMTGFRACTDEDRSDPGTAFICAFVGGLPVIRSYESIVTSSLIQPGSSGSAVYNSSHEVAAVVFAGSGEIGYGFAVPQEYIHMFLNYELPTLEIQYPDTSKQFSAGPSRREQLEKLITVCRTVLANAKNPTCEQLINNAACLN